MQIAGTASHRRALREARPDRRLLPRRRIWVDRLLLTAVLLGLWELVVRAGWISTLFVAPPSSVAANFWRLAATDDVRSAFLDAIVLVLVAFGIAAVAGVLVGAILGLSRLAHSIFHPIAVLFFSTPKLIFIPLVILTLGFESTAKIVYGAVSAFFPIVITVTAGVRLVDRRLLTASRSMGASRWQIVRHVVVPGSMTAIFTSLWYGIQHALLGVLIMELFISQRGIGYFIHIYTGTFQTGRVYALIFALALAAIALTAFWRAVEARLTRWQPRR